MVRSLGFHRKDVHIACKIACRLRENAEKGLDESLERLRTQYFDVYWLHSITTNDDVDKVFGPGGVMVVRVEAKQKGPTHKVAMTTQSEKAAVCRFRLYLFDTLLFSFNWGLNPG